MAEDKVLPVPTGLWLSNTIFSVLVLFVFRRTEQERPVVPEPVTLAGRWLLEGLLIRPYQRLAARLHRKPGHPCLARLAFWFMLIQIQASFIYLAARCTGVPVYNSSASKSPKKQDSVPVHTANNA
jgi:hypothetical protein